MSERDDLEELLRETRERQARALEQELDRRMSRLWRAPERQLRRQLLKPALAVVSIALLFVGAWLYDLSRSGEASSILLFDARYERPKVALREPGDPVRLTQQIAGVPEQEPTLRLVKPGPFTGFFALEEVLVLASLSDSKGNQFFTVDSKIVKVTPEGESSVIAENLDDPRSLAFDSEGNLLVLESGKGRILRIEPKDGEIQPGSPVSVLAEGFASTAMRDESRSERLALELAPEEHVWPVYLAVSKAGEIFVGGRAENGEAVVYKIARKKFKWWKFYCLYRC